MIVIGNYIGRRKAGSSYWATRYPTVLAATSISDSRIDLAWTNNGILDYDDIIIERSLNAVAFVEIDTALLGDTAYSDTTCSPYTFYYYRIRYRKGINYSSYSNTASGRTEELALLSDTNTALWFRHDPTSSEYNYIKSNFANLYDAWIPSVNEILGAESCTDPDFNNAGAWTLQAGWSVAGGLAIADGNTNNTWVYQNTLTVGKTYKATVVCTEYTSGLFYLPFGARIRNTFSSVGTHVTYGTATVAGYMGIAGGTGANALNAKFSSISYKEVKNALGQGTDANMPHQNWSGILTDGVSKRMITAAFTLNQPECIFMLSRVPVYVNNGEMCDGIMGANGMYVINNATLPNGTYIYAGVTLMGDANITIGKYQIHKCLFSGANSWLAIDNNVHVTGDAGTNNLGGFSIGSDYVGTNPINCEYREIIVRKTAPSVADETAILNYLIQVRYRNMKDYNNVLVLGNSLEWHNIYEHWWGEWGMMASVMANDIPHKLQEKIRTINGNCTVRVCNIAAWEVNHATYDKSNFDSYFNVVPDLVIIRMGDNITDETDLGISFQDLIDYVYANAADCKIAVGGVFYADASKDATFLSVCNTNGIPFQPMADLNVPANVGSIGDTVYDAEGNPHLIDDAGVAAHPDDIGQNLIAERLFGMI